MKTCLRLTFFVCLLVTTLRAAATDTVRVSTPDCIEGNAFTLKVPFYRLPPGVDTVWYRWYLNGQPAPDAAEGITTSDNRSISYTIPADSAYGTSVQLYFDFRLDDCCDEWTSSPVYVVSFTPLTLDCVLSSTGSVEGDDVSDFGCQLNTAGSVEGDDVLDVACALRATGSIEGDDDF